MRHPAKNQMPNPCSCSGNQGPPIGVVDYLFYFRSKRICAKQFRFAICRVVDQLNEINLRVQHVRRHGCGDIRAIAARSKNSAAPQNLLRRWVHQLRAIVVFVHRTQTQRQDDESRSCGYVNFWDRTGASRRCGQEQGYRRQVLDTVRQSALRSGFVSCGTARGPVVI